MSVQPTNPLITEISMLVETRTGIAASAQPRGTLHDIVISLAKGDVDNYFQRLRIYKETDPIWQDLLNALTIGETYFLRDRAHFHLLREYILPDIIEKHRHDRTLNIWSIGCATGEEPYSLAITLSEILPDYRDWDINITGLDLNARALHTARRGVYRKWAFRHTDIDFQNRYFDPTPTGLQIKTELQRMVHFRNANLFASHPQFNSDLILCRNVLLYFSRDYTRRAEMILHDALQPEGWLLLGHAEMLRHQRDSWLENIFPGSPVYKKPIADTVETPDQVTYKRKTLTQELVSVTEKQDNAEVTYIYHEAVAALQEENYIQAENTLDRLIQMNPEHAAGHALLACIYANRNDTMKAHTEIDTALYLDPLLADAHYLRATLYIEQSCKEDTFDALRASLYCQRNHPLSSFMLGNLYAQEGDLSRARRYWQNTLRTIQSLRADSPVSDISPMTAGHLTALVSEQLEGWQ